MGYSKTPLGTSKDHTLHCTTWSRHLLALNIHIPETTLRLTIIQLRSWSHQPTPTTKLHTTTLTVPPVTPATSDKPSVLLLKPSSTPVTPVNQPITPQPAKPTPTTAAPTPVLRWSRQTQRSHRRSSLLTHCCFWPSLLINYYLELIHKENHDNVPAHRPSMMMWLYHMKTTMMMCHASPYPWWCDCPWSGHILIFDFS